MTDVAGKRLSDSMVEIGSEQQPWLERLEEVDLVILTGVKKRRRIIFRLEKDEVQKHRELLKELFGACYQEQQE